MKNLIPRPRVKEPTFCELVHFLANFEPVGETIPLIFNMMLEKL